MTQLYADAARGSLASGIAAGDTVITLNGLGNLFPTTVAPDFFKGVLQDVAGFEIVYCTAHANSSNTFTVTRGQEGTTARAFAAGSIFGIRPTAQDMRGKMEKSANLSDLADKPTSRSNLDVYSTSETVSQAIAMAIALG